MRRPRTPICFLWSVLAAACASTSPAPPSPRLMAEWEPALGTLIVHPLALPDALVADLGHEATLYVLVQADRAEEARAELAELGLEPASYALLSTPARSPWTRDWGPHQVVAPGGHRVLVDHVFRGYPWVPAECTVADVSYGWDMSGEDDAVPALASALDLETVLLPAIATGGNLLTDGHGRAFCTEALLTENLAQPVEVRPRRRRARATDPEASEGDGEAPPPAAVGPLRAPIDETAFRELLRERMGVTELVVLENTEPFGIQHIDCWLKVLDPETLLVKRAPEGHPEHDPIERNVERLCALRTPSGGTYRVVRIDCPPFAEDRLPAYTNSLRLNDVVHVPLYGIDADARALETYRAALPGCEVRGYPFDGWQHFDALHCRARALHDDPAGIGER
ncbi:MAG: agmatine deiminase family protein [Planctomycetes bacterium]|nr:agmatine deiminase family protein [Planctomycetota bacterium]